MIMYLLRKFSTHVSSIPLSPKTPLIPHPPGPSICPYPPTVSALPKRPTPSFRSNLVNSSKILHPIAPVRARGSTAMGWGSITVNVGRRSIDASMSIRGRHRRDADEEGTARSGAAGKKKEGFMPWHSVRLNLLTRFQAALATPRPSPPFPLPSPPSSTSSVARRSFMITSASSVRPTLHSWNLGWHLVNRERRRPWSLLHELGTSRCESGPQTPSPKPLDTVLPCSSPRPRGARDTSRLLFFQRAPGSIDYTASSPRCFPGTVLFPFSSLFPRMPSCSRRFSRLPLAYANPRSISTAGSSIANATRQ